MHIDIFCQIIDNYGDIGVCWRLAQQLSQKKTVHKIRLFVDDLNAFARIEPQVQPHLDKQQIVNISICHWPQADTATPAEMVIEAFGCDLPPAYIGRMPGQTELWLNLEYLSAEDWVADLHGMPSPQPNGIVKHFFFPGFNAKTGGLLRPPASPRALPDANFWKRLGINAPNTNATAFVFAYPNAPLDVLYEALEQDSASWTVLLAATVTPPSNIKTLNATVYIETLPYLSQADFDILMDYADLNVARGEDSFVRAIWAAKPFIWQPYIQADEAHLKKLSAWLNHTSFDASIHHAIQTWSQGTIDVKTLQPLLQQRTLWQQQCADYALELAQQADLTTQLLTFYSQKLQKAVK